MKHSKISVLKVYVFSFKKYYFHWIKLWSLNQRKIEEKITKNKILNKIKTKIAKSTLPFKMDYSRIFLS